MRLDLFGLLLDLLKRSFGNLNLDILFCDDMADNYSWKNTGNAIDNLEYYKTLKKRRTNSNDVHEIMQAYPDVDFRYMVMP